MDIVWSKIIEKFAPEFGMSKEQIEEVYNKPDKSKVMAGTYVSVKFYDGYAILVTFFYELEKLHIMNAYKLLPSMLTVDVKESDSLEILEDFMKRFGMEVDVPGIGKVKTYINKDKHKFYPGMLDIEKYAAAMKGA